MLILKWTNRLISINRVWVYKLLNIVEDNKITNQVPLILIAHVHFLTKTFHKKKFFMVFCSKLKDFWTHFVCDTLRDMSVSNINYTCMYINTSETYTRQTFFSCTLSFFTNSIFLKRSFSSVFPILRVMSWSY